MDIAFKQGRSKTSATAFLVDKSTDWASLKLDRHTEKAIKLSIKNGLELISQTEGENKLIFCYIGDFNESHITQEHCRRLGFLANKHLNENRISDVTLQNNTGTRSNMFAFAEGVCLSNYQFLKYISDKKKLSNALNKIFIPKSMLSEKEMSMLKISVEGNFLARDLVNEPLSYLTAVQLGKEIVRAGKVAGFKTTVFDKKKIVSLKMGGLLAVNMGSKTPPTFSILEWKPAKAKNKKPVVLVGKGVVYDTGGLSLKPTPNSMDKMKSDMGGAAAVIGTMYAVAKAKLPVHVIGLVPSTDNRPGENAYVPGDIITMHDKTTVEVLNTDAEGRLLLADALSYAKRYKPDLVIDLATLTGAAARALGPQGIVTMGNANGKVKAGLSDSGNAVYERLVEFPLWEEYGEQLKTPIADLKNIGGPMAGAITAGKFLEHFTDYPWMHMDIAGPSFLSSNYTYRGCNATGVGVRLLFHYLANNHS